MYRGPMLQELSDDQLEMVAGGDVNISISSTNIIIFNSQFVNSPVDSFNGNVNVIISYTGGNGSITAPHTTSKLHH
jgi:hypothetical protein